MLWIKINLHKRKNANKKSLLLVILLLIHQNFIIINFYVSKLINLKYAQKLHTHTQKKIIFKMWKVDFT